MTLHVSTGLRNAILTTGSLKSQLDGGFIKIYAGSIPTDADQTLGSAVLLTTISVSSGGTGLTMATPATGGALTKTTSEVWSGVNAASGTAAFWRFVKTGDTGILSTTDLRLQGVASTSGTELVMTSLALSIGGTQNIDYFTIGLPG
jgi:hypothetical protein